MMNNIKKTSLLIWNYLSKYGYMSILIALLVLSLIFVIYSPVIVKGLISNFVAKPEYNTSDWMSFFTVLITTILAFMIALFSLLYNLNVHKSKTRKKILGEFKMLLIEHSNFAYPEVELSFKDGIIDIKNSIDNEVLSKSLKKIFENMYLAILKRNTLIAPLVKDMITKMHDNFEIERNDVILFLCNRVKLSYLNDGESYDYYYLDNESFLKHIGINDNETIKKYCEQMNRIYEENIKVTSNIYILKRLIHYY